ncbi:cobalt transporter CbiM [bacterium]|nr:cobalt transporter CbiM [bacterium]NIN92056.1 cobalt transporter CbiM [bacterium]NIO18269.1 cobalt transporter CbiM [bacterium]NIO73243.1 cobalt transporter CbiM [bacterium]
MHISEGVLSAPVLLTGVILSAGGVSLGLKKMDYERIPEVAVLTSAFFVASLIHVPIGPSSAHLVLNGLVGLLLGWPAFSAILVGLSLQALLFQFGGITSLGVNTFNIALPAVVSFYLFRLFTIKHNPYILLFSAFLCGVVGILGSALLVALSLVTTGEAFLTVAKLVVIAHLPVMVIEGLITATAVVSLKKIRPELLTGKAKI